MLAFWIILLIAVFVVGGIVAKHDDENYQELLKQFTDKSEDQL